MRIPKAECQLRASASFLVFPQIGHVRCMDERKALRQYLGMRAFQADCSSDVFDWTLGPDSYKDKTKILQEECKSISFFDNLSQLVFFDHAYLNRRGLLFALHNWRLRYASITEKGVLPKYTRFWRSRNHSTSRLWLLQHFRERHFERIPGIHLRSH